jgi:hypothetical protein
MLAKKRFLNQKEEELEETPLLIPAFSSKAFPEIKKIFKTMEEFIDGPILISAYDIHHIKLYKKITFPSIIFLDSGGYECSKDFDLSTIYHDASKPKIWNIKLLGKILNSWPHDIPTVAVSFDHPRIKKSIREQIESAKLFFQKRPLFLSDILLKPERKEQQIIEIESVIKNIDSLNNFDIIGFTEKELGNSILERMTNIAKIRIELNKCNINIPIHIFGSLDPISAPLYFISGADIFDGLTWLRFSYYNGMTIYPQNYNIIKNRIEQSNWHLKIRACVDNIGSLNDLKIQMKKFLSSGDFKEFKSNSNFIKESYKSLKSKMKGV